MKRRMLGVVATTTLFSTLLTMPVTALATKDDARKDIVANDPANNMATPDSVADRLMRGGGGGGLDTDADSARKDANSAEGASGLAKLQARLAADSAKMAGKKGEEADDAADDAVKAKDSAKKSAKDSDKGAAKDSDKDSDKDAAKDSDKDAAKDSDKDAAKDSDKDQEGAAVSVRIEDNEVHMENLSSSWVDKLAVIHLSLKGKPLCKEEKKVKDTSMKMKLSKCDFSAHKGKSVRATLLVDDKKVAKGEIQIDGNGTAKGTLEAVGKKGEKPSEKKTTTLPGTNTDYAQRALLSVGVACIGVGAALGLYLRRRRMMV